MELGFTGTRGALTQAQAETLCKALWYYRKYCAVMHNGDCIGADAYAADYWTRCGGKIWLHPPTARGKRAFIACAVQSKPLPYLQRNMQIVLHADVVLAAPKENSEITHSGTWATIRYARAAGKQLSIIYPSGRTETHDQQNHW